MLEFYCLKSSYIKYKKMTRSWLDTVLIFSAVCIQMFSVLFFTFFFSHQIFRIWILKRLLLFQLCYGTLISQIFLLALILKICILYSTFT